MSNTTHGRAALIERYHWLTFLLPFVVFAVLTSLEPSPGGNPLRFGKIYPWVYAIKIALILAAMAFVWPGYRQFRPRVTVLAILVGILGGPLWIALSVPNWEHAYLLPLLKQIGLDKILSMGERPGFNPFDPAYQLSAAGAWTFMAVRFLGLVAVVPVIEEFFLRGFVMRFVIERDWWAVPFGKVTGLAVVLGTLVPVLMHPEWLAAFVWFSLITWLMVRTRNIWDCVAAHAITNLILGVYVVWSGCWRLM